MYHCISRVVAGERLLDDAAKEVLRKMLWQVAAFSGVEILAYCILSNHFHVLVRVTPIAQEEKLDRRELLRRYQRLYSAGGASPYYPTPEVLASFFELEGAEADAWENRLRARMGDVSEFMKTLKQRFAIWFNQTHQRFGTLWSERFKSLLIENTPFTLQTVAAYIDLNPVRAGLVSDPADYRWCSYAEAMAGQSHARAHLQVICDAPDWSGALESYRVALFGKGGVPRKEGEGIVSPERVRQILASGGLVPRHELLLCRLKFLSHGLILGSTTFIEDQVARLRETGLIVSEDHAKSKRRRRIPFPIPLPVDPTSSGTLAPATWRRIRDGVGQNRKPPPQIG